MSSSSIPPAETPPSPQDRKLFVGLGASKSSITVAMLREHFAKFGEVASVFQPKHKRTGMPRGFAFVQFKRREDAQRALTADPDSHVVGRWKEWMRRG
ncbi:nuclear localization sequence-binding protein-like [Brachypodium distachyon]|uniref:nuclear localization sequence-binding protein-like n=1 Tax=Brachypodium distachyon TaxID=15368 RepID=UPI000D0E06BE|nr:nuclear localization sequence-binding protein-like [Brachypodium distachyon]|eukprot:XP_024314042.1 nuclear localization sequence-binding protein-like [Brachypodium distachyon]